MASENTKGMIRYTSRDYASMLDDMVNAVPKLTELWKPEATADPGYVLMTLLASAADVLGVNLDWLANEMYAPSVTQRKNAEKVFGLIGYNLGWYTAARTEVTFKNSGDTPITIDFGFNGANFATLNAYTDITQQPRVITYNVLPMTSSYGSTTTRSKRSIVTDAVDVFASTDKVTLEAGESITRVAVEGELRSCTVSVQQVKNNGYIIKLPSQHIDTRSIWIKAKSTLHSEDFLTTRWIQVESVAQFIDPEPRFAVTYDNYSNAQITVSNYLNQLDNYDNNYLTVYWIECSGVIGSVSQDVLENFQPAIPASTSSNSYDPEALTISNLSNTIELPHTYTVTGKSPETAKEAYFNSRNYINTWDSLITLPDFNRFIKREAGVDAGLVIDCQKALEINLAIYQSDMTEAQKSKQYITAQDFPVDTNANLNWRNIISSYGVDTNASDLPQIHFKTSTAVCYAVHNDFKDSMNYIGTHYVDDTSTNSSTSANTVETPNYIRYKPPVAFVDSVIDDFRPLQAMTVDMQFGYTRVFPWYVVGEIYPVHPVDEETGNVLIAIVKEALQTYFSAANREYGQKPTVMEVVNVIQGADSRIRYFDAGSLANPVINWGERKLIGGKSKIVKYDVEYFNPISFAKYQDVGSSETNIRIASDYLIKS